MYIHCFEPEKAEENIGYTKETVGYTKETTGYSVSIYMVYRSISKRRFGYRSIYHVYTAMPIGMWISIYILCIYMYIDVYQCFWSGGQDSRCVGIDCDIIGEIIGEIMDVIIYDIIDL